MHRLAALALAALLAAACGPPAPAGPEMILTGATIYPAPGVEPVSALAIQGNAIVALGSDDEIRALADDDTQEMPLDGAVVLPGFHDAWLDLIALGALEHRVDLRLTTSEREVQAKLRAALATRAEAIIGWGWDERRWPDAAAPTSAALDAVSTDLPIVLYRRDGQVAWLNTPAIDAAGVGGELVTLDGAATGLVAGDAVTRVRGTIDDLRGDAQREVLLGALRTAAAAGLTSVGTAPLSQYEADLLASLAPEDVTIRVEARLLPGVTPPSESSHLRFAALGIDADGPLALGLAARDSGTVPAIEAACAAATQAGLPLDVHVRGEAGVEQAARCEATRHIVGADILPATELPPTASLIAMPGRMAHDMYWLEAELGEAVERAHSYRDWARRGLLGGIASDGPASDIRPMESLRIMFTRRDREGYPLDGWRATERLAPADTMRALLAAAPLSGELAAGRKADLVVWSEDPFAGEGELERAQAMLVFVDGRVIYSRPLVTPNLDRRQ